MEELLKNINNLKVEYDSLKPLGEKEASILWEKFRLEWNYNSNHIEGNTMTYGETQLLLRLGDEFKAQNNSLKDVNEMRAHDTAIFVIRDMAKEGRALIQKDIRELNQTILVKDYYANAQTQDGQPTRKQIKVGEYKEHPNHVRLKSGEIFRYAEPHEVPAKMQELLEWYNAEKDEHPLITAAFLHYKFVIIHPFDDGNGRVSRLLMNYHLMKNGYPPLIIKSEDKENYLYALSEADAGNTAAFIEYLGNQLIWSLELAIKAGKGKSVSEQTDIYKEIEVWKKQLKSDIPTNPRRDDKLSLDLYDQSISKLFKEIESKSATFKNLFLNYKPTRSFMSFQNGQNMATSSAKIDVIRYNSKNKFSDEFNAYRLSMKFSNPLNQAESETLKIDAKIIVNLNTFDYTVSIDNQDQGIKKSYSDHLTDEEIENLTNAFMKNLFEKVKKVVD